MRDRHGVAQLAQTHIRNLFPDEDWAGSVVAQPPPTMTRDQFVLCASVFTGSTIRDLRHLRDEPRASMPLFRRVPKATKPPLRELEAKTSSAHART